MTDNEVLAAKQEIAEFAVHHYEQHGEAPDFETINHELELSEKGAESFFEDSDDLFVFYYQLLLLQYEAMIEDLEEFPSLSLSEKLSNFIYTILDMLSETDRFTEETFSDIIYRGCGKSDFQDKTEEILEHFIEDDPRVAASSKFVTNPLFYRYLSGEFLYIILFWLDDETEGREQTMALVDKSTSFLEEIMYSEALDKGIDLARFLYNNGVVSHRFPILKYLNPGRLFS